jgi:hypothetical protein
MGFDKLKPKAGGKKLRNDPTKNADLPIDRDGLQKAELLGPGACGEVKSLRSVNVRGKSENRRIRGVIALRQRIRGNI